MKKLIVSLLVLTLVFALTACGSGDNNFTMDTAALIDELHKANLFEDSLVPITDSALKNVVGVDTSLVKEYTYEMGTGVTGEELGVLTCVGSKEAADVLSQVDAHRQDYISQYESYKPDAIPRMEGAVLIQKGPYVIYVAAQNNEQAQKIVDSFINK